LNRKNKELVPNPVAYGTQPPTPFEQPERSNLPLFCRGTPMFTSNRYRDKAAEYAERGENANGSREVKEFARLEKNFTTLADNEQWLSESYQRTVQACVVDPPGSSGLAEQEEHVLRCIGAAVIMQWSGLPADIRRQLFDCASTMGDALDIASLRERIARFVHKHQDAPAESNKTTQAVQGVSSSTPSSPAAVGPANPAERADGC